MPRYVTSYCPKCPNKYGSAEIIGSYKDQRLVKCDDCGEEYLQDQPDIIQRGNRYPYMSGSLGEVVQSRDHEEALAKKMGMTHQDWGRVKVPRKRKNPHRAH